MANKISVEVDVNTKEVKFAGGEVTRLAQQVRVLTEELNKMQAAGQVGSEKYQILVEKLNDTKDAMDRTKLAAGEIYGTLSAMPGPIGQIGSSLNTTIDSFKLLGSLKTTELRAQFAGLLKDVKDAGAGFLNLIGFTKTYETVLAGLTGVKNKDTVATVANAEATEVSAVAQTQNATATTADTAATTANTSAKVAGTAAARAFALAIAAIPFLAIAAAIGALIAYWDDLKDAVTGATTVSKAYGEAQKEATSQVKEFEQSLYKVKDAFARAKAGTMDKQVALDEYNNTLGDTVGYATSIEQAEDLMVKNTPVVVAALTKRAIAQSLISKVAELEAGIVTGAIQKDMTLLDRLEFGAIRIKGIFQGFDKSWQEEMGRQGRKAEGVKKEITALKGEIQTLLDDAIADDKLRKGVVLTKPGTGTGTKAKTQEEKDKELIEGLNRSIELEINSENTRREKLEELLKQRRALNQKYQKLNTDDYKNALEADKKVLEKAMTEDADTRMKHGEEIIKNTRENSQKAADDSLRILQAELDKELQAIDVEENKKKEDKKLSEKELIQIEIDARKKREQLQLAFAEKQLQFLKNQKQKELDAIDQAVKDLNITEKQAAELRLKIADNYADKIFAKEKEIGKTKTDIVVNASKDIAKANKDEKDTAAKSLDDQLKILQMQGENMATWSKAYYDNRKAQLDAQMAKELESVEAGSAAELRIKERYKLLEQELDKQVTRSKWQAAGQAIAAAASVFDALAGLLDAEAENNKEAFEKRKKLQIASAVMNVASGVIGVWTNPPFGPGTAIWKAIQTAALLITTGIQINKIKQSEFKPKDDKTAKSDKAVGTTFAKGGLLDGPSHSQGGIKTSFGELEGGEYVVNRRSTESFLPLLTAINSAGNRKYQDGGMMANMDTIQAMMASQPQPIVKTYVVASDMTSQQEANKKLMDLAKI